MIATCRIVFLPKVMEGKTGKRQLFGLCQIGLEILIVDPQISHIHPPRPLPQKHCSIQSFLSVSHACQPRNSKKTVETSAKPACSTLQRHGWHKTKPPAPYLSCLSEFSCPYQSHASTKVPRSQEVSGCTRMILVYRPLAAHFQTCSYDLCPNVMDIGRF
ncbi:hypothetical protein B0H34DRAFT_450865 [Crassisporium funariophilum]|nr:hypothetical protein B0H34DRAFT_450865 [Crassisporium funariophilum]